MTQTTIKPKPTTKTKAKLKRRFTRDYTPEPKPRNGIEFFYASLVAWGIIVKLDGDNLVIETPNNNVSPRLQEHIDKRKVALVEHLKGLPK